MYTIPITFDPGNTGVGTIDLPPATGPTFSNPGVVSSPPGGGKSGGTGGSGGGKTDSNGGTVTSGGAAPAPTPDPHYVSFGGNPLGAVIRSNQASGGLPADGFSKDVPLILAVEATGGAALESGVVIDWVTAQGPTIARITTSVYVRAVPVGYFVAKILGAGEGFAEESTAAKLGIPSFLAQRQNLHVPPVSDGRSVLTSDPAELLEGIHQGLYPILRSPKPGQVLVNFGKMIGEYWSNGVKVGMTQFGYVNFGQKGAHIIPANPNQW